MTKVILSGFGPFGTVEHNPSATIAQKAELHAGLDVERYTLPVTPEACDKFLAEILPKQPDFLLCFGVAANQNKVCLEKTARNILKYSEEEKPIDPQGVESIHTSLSRLEEMAAASKKAGLPACVSQDAGNYICNYLYYKALMVAPSSTSVLFVHVPLPYERLSLEKMLDIPQILLAGTGGK